MVVAVVVVIAGVVAVVVVIVAVVLVALVCLRVLPAPAAGVVLAVGRHLLPSTCLSSPASQTAAPPSHPTGREHIFNIGIFNI